MQIKTHLEQLIPYLKPNCFILVQNDKEINSSTAPLIAETLIEHRLRPMFFESASPGTNWTIPLDEQLVKLKYNIRYEIERRNVNVAIIVAQPGKDLDKIFAAVKLFNLSVIIWLNEGENNSKITSFASQIELEEHYATFSIEEEQLQSSLVF